MGDFISASVPHLEGKVDDGIAITGPVVQTALGLALTDQRRAMHNRVKTSRPVEEIADDERGGPRTPDRLKPANAIPANTAAMTPIASRADSSPRITAGTLRLAAWSQKQSGEA
ncbi:hypothetical protein [Mycolicibacterium sp. GF69]|uniref:hypothetical protein n=1 Tax=Mycolicibacterium sp. GF69 TaxID=2267251 RepID=UPI00197B393A|nr:hypothetical protein [Mycolicibacterium sp. GF69]